MVKTGDFKTSNGIVQVNTEKGGGEAGEPLENDDVEDFVDFVGEQHMNFGEYDPGDDPCQILKTVLLSSGSILPKLAKNRLRWKTLKRTPLK